MSSSVTGKDETILHPAYRQLSPVRRLPVPVMSSRLLSASELAAARLTTPGPGSYETGVSWSKPQIHWQPPQPKVLTPRTPSKAEAASSSQAPASPRSGKGFSMSWRPEQAPVDTKRPGPGSYDLRSAFGTASTTTKCTFGLRPDAAAAVVTPGPGAYEAEVKTRYEGGMARGTTMVGRVVPSAPRKGPTATTYHLKSPFDTSSGRCATIKGKLPHPMVDHNASHEAARTSVPHDPTRRMKKRPEC